MKKMIVSIAAAAVVTMSVGAAQANGWGSRGGQQTYHSGGLVNVSPSVNLGSLNALNNVGILNGNAILSGNRTNTSIGNGILSGIGVGILSGNNNNQNRSSGHRR